jgi:streptogramin lyase
LQTGTALMCLPASSAAISAMLVCGETATTGEVMISAAVMDIAGSS